MSSLCMWLLLPLMHSEKLADQGVGKPALPLSTTPHGLADGKYMSSKMHSVIQAVIQMATGLKRIV